MTTLGNIIKINGTLQHEPWGGAQFIPELLNIHNTLNQFFSEVQFDAQSTILSTDNQTLKQYIEQYPGIYLGKQSLQSFGPKLPFELKLIDVNAPLCIRVHPNKQQAENGFARQQAGSIGNLPPDFTYTDTNHKPKFMVALSDFWQLQGLRSIQGIQKTFAGEPTLEKLLEPVRHAGIRVFLETILALDANGLDHILTPLIEKYMTSYRNKSLPPTMHHYWVMHCAARRLLNGESLDSGLLLIYLMNLMHIPPGGSVYIAPSTIHTYLQGQAVEVSTNSNNVLKIGLTADARNNDEFFKVANLNPYPAEVVYGVPMPDGGLTYKTPIQDFQLNQYHWQTDSNYAIEMHASPRFWFVLEGNFQAHSQACCHQVMQGEAFFQKPNTALSIQTATDCRVFMVEIQTSATKS